MNSCSPAKHRQSVLVITKTIANNRRAQEQRRCNLDSFTENESEWSACLWRLTAVTVVKGLHFCYSDHLRIWQRVPFQPGRQWQLFGPTHSPPFKHFCRHTAGGTETERETTSNKQTNKAQITGIHAILLDYTSRIVKYLVNITYELWDFYTKILLWLFEVIPATGIFPRLDFC